MMGRKRAGYNRVVFGRCWWRGAATLLLALSFWTGLAAHARADDQIGVGPTPWLDVQLSSGSLTVKTWNRPQVQVVTDGRVDVRHISAADADPRIPKEYTTWSQTVSTDRGDVKLLSTALKELRYSFKVFAPYRRRRKVTVFGSARLGPRFVEQIGVTDDLASIRAQPKLSEDDRVALDHFTRAWVAHERLGEMILEFGNTSIGQERFEQRGEPAVALAAGDALFHVDARRRAIP